MVEPCRPPFLNLLCGAKPNGRFGSTAVVQNLISPWAAFGQKRTLADHRSRVLLRLVNIQRITQFTTCIYETLE